MKTHSSLGAIRLKKWEIQKTILEVIILSVISGGGSWTKPTLPLLIRSIRELLQRNRKLNLAEKKIRRSLLQFEKKDIIGLYQKDQIIYVSVNKNHPTLLKYSLKPILDFRRKEKKWNGKWYMVFFDVPEMQRNKRNYLRLFLKKLGFYPYQKSVYLFPYECEREILLVKKIVEGGKYMKYIIADKIEDEKRIKNFFHLA